MSDLELPDLPERQASARTREHVVMRLLAGAPEHLGGTGH